MSEQDNCQGCALKNQTSPDLQAFAKMLVENVREVSRQESRALVAEISTMFDQKLYRIEQKLESIERRQEQHSVEIAQIKTQMDAGERRFVAIEKRQADIEKTGVKNSIDLAGIAATIGKTAVAGGVGGGVVLGIAKMLGV
jgi:predicted GNAT family acetyltransferase